MRRFIVIVLDGFGIGMMDDVPSLRPQDKGSNTAVSIFKALPELTLPTLTSLGLGNAILAAGSSNNNCNNEYCRLAVSDTSCYGVHNLAHFGADTFWGHQELMGTKPLKGESAPICSKLPEIQKALEDSGYNVRFYSQESSQNSGASQGDDVPGILIVDEGVTIGDNLETDLGDNYNVTIALDIIPFEKAKKIGALVRSLVHSSRVIVFGGEGVGLNDLLSAYESRRGYAGVNAPRSGVYRSGYQVLHLGYGVNSKVQVPAVLDRAGISTVLIGKVADIVENPHGKNIPGVDTEAMLKEGVKALDSLKEGFICINVQETDLAGHREDPGLYAERLVLADKGIKTIMNKMYDDDILVVTADHGNDPAIGHPQHTREKTPILAWNPRIVPGFLGERSSLADTGASVCEYFRASPPESGSSYLNMIKFK